MCGVAWPSVLQDAHSTPQGPRPIPQARARQVEAQTKLCRSMAGTWDAPSGWVGHEMGKKEGRNLILVALFRRFRAPPFWPIIYY